VTQAEENIQHAEPGGAGSLTVKGSTAGTVTLSCAEIALINSLG
jgi:hypothetical protein